MSGPFGSSQWMYNAGSDHEIANSVRLSEGAYLERDYGSASNRRLFTVSVWFKKALSLQSAAGTIVFGGADNDYAFRILIDTNEKINVYDYAGASNQKDWEFITTAELLDTSTWYHFVFAFDTAQATNTNRVKMYLNGTQISAFDTSSYPARNFQSNFNTAELHVIGDTYSHDGGFDGYLADVNIIDGAALGPTSFGKFDSKYGHWVPVDTSGLTPGTNGLHLDFALPAASATGIGNDIGAEENDLTPSGYAVGDQVHDSPTNNFCTWQSEASFGEATLTEGNLRYNPNGIAGWLFGSIGVSTGKWYFETLRKTAGNSYHTMIANDTWIPTSGDPNTAGSYALYSGTYFYAGEGAVNLSFGAGSDADIIGIAFDLDNNKIWFAKNNTFYNSGDPAAGSNPTQVMDGQPNNFVRPATSHGNASYDGLDQQNFGQDSSFSGEKTAQGNTDSEGFGDFFYEPPNGFLALCTKNLPEPDVVANDYFNTLAYSGNSTNNRAITGVGFAPDFIWSKARSEGYTGSIYDRVRGAGRDYHLTSQETEAEGTGNYVYGHISAFGTDGYTLSEGADSGNPFANENEDGTTYVSWNWKAGGSGSANNEGSINTTKTSANVEAGFSIMTYTGNATSGATIGHGLEAAPEWILLKKRNAAVGWMVYHIGNTAAPATEELNLEVTEATQDSDNIWNDTLPSTTLISIGNNSAVNANNDLFVAYAWHSVPGYSQIGSYVGNNNANGAFVYTGFRPAFVLRKRTDATSNWTMVDNKREGFNGTGSNDELFANIANAETNADRILLLANGFKAITTDANVNANNGKYIYAAFAEVSTKFSNAR
tara:strand:- start:7 stop:2484 length:2478 start_codon:yes stop_codon:yes gene_type:complete